MFLLGLVYVVLVGVLIAASAAAGVIVVVAVGLLLFQLFASDKIALATLGAHEVSPPRSPSCTRSSSGCASRRTCPSRGCA